MESPPPYDDALQQPNKENSLLQHQNHRDYLDTNNKLITGLDTPLQIKHTTTSHSYSALNPSQNNLSLLNSTTGSMQHLQYQHQNQQPSLQYTTVQSLENRARSRNPLNGLPNEIDNQTQYSNIAQLSSTPIDV